MNKKLLKYYMETEPESTAKKYIFLVDNQDIAMNIVLSDYQTVYLGQKEEEGYYSIDGFVGEMPQNLEDKSDAFYRRLLVLDMNQMIPREEKDIRLKRSDVFRMYGGYCEDNGRQEAQKNALFTACRISK